MSGRSTGCTPRGSERVQVIHDAARSDTYSRAVDKISLEWVRKWGTQKGTRAS
jgi:hypothetical protein